MNIIVCVKQVPSSDRVALDPVTKTIVRKGNELVNNPYDMFALELAVSLKEKLGGRVTALSMGIPAAAELLGDVVSRGADNAMLLTDRGFAGADTLATSYTLSCGIKMAGAFDLIICGRMAVDGDTAQIGPELAELCGIPHITEVSEVVSVTDKSIICRHSVDNGSRISSLPLPALITVDKGINTPRLPSITGIRYAVGTEPEIYGAETLGADTSRTGLNGSPTRVVSTAIPERSAQAREIGGDIAAAAKFVADIAEGCR